MLLLLAIILGFVVCNAPSVVSGMPQTSSIQDNACCICGPKISITLKAENKQVQPLFNMSINVTSHRRQLIYILEQAVEIDLRFRFSADYYGKQLGYTLNAINDVYPIDRTIMAWVITNQKYEEVALSSYIPNDGDVLLFELYRRPY